MTFLLTNDDGIDAPGIQALLEAVSSLDLKAVITAPQEHHSGCSHQVTTTSPIHVQQRSETEYGVSGTPVDCIRIALSHLFPETTWVLSGINAGGNLGADVYISGTVAAVREAALHRIPAIAISHYKKRGHEIDWNLASALAANVLSDLLARPVVPGTFWNVNLPHLEPDAPTPEIVFCNPCTQPLPANYRIQGDYYYYAGEYAKRSRDPEGDVEICFSDRISVTQLSI